MEMIFSKQVKHVYTSSQSPFDFLAEIGVL